MSPTGILLVSGSLALIAVVLVFARLREHQRIRSIVEELEASDSHFSTQLSRIKEVLERLDDDQSDLESAGQVTEESSDPHQKDWWARASAAGHKRALILRFTRRAHPDENPSRAYLRGEARSVDYASGRAAEVQWQREDMIHAGR